jgi:LuxR family transcriptional regulator, maltose regulon positive regulatory protein
MRAAATEVVARPALFALLAAAAPSDVTLVAAPAGSGKTVLVRSWIDSTSAAARTAWVSIDRGERDAQRFWLAVVEKLRALDAAEDVVEQLTPAPDFDGAAVVDRLVSQLGSLEQPILLVIDDLHELLSPAALGQLERLLAHRPPLLHIVLISRHDPQLSLHRLRLAGQLSEIRAPDLRFTLEETRQLLAGSGIVLSDHSVSLLQARTEGWAAGLRLAAISLARHPQPEQLVAEFAGSERTVAEYLLAEVLERQTAEVRRLLLRTSILERVSGPLADLLVGTSGSERILQELEAANAFVVAFDAGRTWFRYPVHAPPHVRHKRARWLALTLPAALCYGTALRRRAPARSASAPAPDLSAWSSVTAALISDRWLNAWGKLPSCSPVGLISSE